MFAHGFVGKHEDREVEGNRWVTGDVEREDIAPGHRQLVGEDAGQSLGFCGDLLGIGVVVVFCTPRTRGFPILGLDIGHAVLTDDDELGEYCLAVRIDQHLGIAQLGLFALQCFDARIDGAEFVVVQFGGFAGRFDFGMFGIDRFNTRGGFFAERCAFKPRLGQVFAVRPAGGLRG